MPEWCLRPCDSSLPGEDDVRRAGLGQRQHAGGHRAEHHRAPGDAGRPAPRAVQRRPHERHARLARHPAWRRTARCRRRAGPGAGRARRRGRARCRTRSTWGRGGRPGPRSGASAARASSSVTAGGTSSTRSADAVALATRWSPSRRRTCRSLGARCLGIERRAGGRAGAGEARRTVTAGRRAVVGTCAATVPLTQPPLPDSGGPQKRWGMVISTAPTYPRGCPTGYLDVEINAGGTRCAAAPSRSTTGRGGQRCTVAAG